MPLIDLPLHAAELEVGAAIRRSLKHYPRPFNDAQEAYCVMLEQLDQLWNEIKDGKDTAKMRAKACEVAAMALRFMLDVTNA